MTATEATRKSRILYDARGATARRIESEVKADLATSFFAAGLHVDTGTMLAAIAASYIWPIRGSDFVLWYPAGVKYPDDKSKDAANRVYRAMGAYRYGGVRSKNEHLTRRARNAIRASHLAGRAPAPHGGTIKTRGGMTIIIPRAGFLAAPTTAKIRMKAKMILEQELRARGYYNAPAASKAAA